MPWVLTRFQTLPRELPFTSVSPSRPGPGGPALCTHLPVDWFLFAISAGSPTLLVSVPIYCIFPILYPMPTSLTFFSFRVRLHRQNMTAINVKMTTTPPTPMTAYFHMLPLEVVDVPLVFELVLGSLAMLLVGSEEPGEAIWVLLTAAVVRSTEGALLLPAVGEVWMTAASFVGVTRTITSPDVVPQR